MCDLQRPAYGNCIRARLTCKGYARQWTFLENEPVVRGHGTAVVARRPPKSHSPPLRFLPDDLSRTAFKIKSISLFWDLYFPANERVVPKSRIVAINFCNWTVAVRKLDLSDSALRPALLALSLAQIGQSNNDRAVSEQAVKLYGTALKEMSLALRDQARVQTDELLAAGKAMAGYEVTTPYTRLILAAIVSRKPSFFASPLWQTLTLDDGDKDLSDALFDLMATLPLLLQDFDLLQLCDDAAEVRQRGIQLWYRCRATDRGLQQWYERLSSKVPQPLPSAIRTPADRSDSPEAEGLFLFEESDYALATTLALYWATCNLLHSLIHMAHAYFRSSGLSECSQEIPEHIDPRRSATSIAHSVAYFIRPEMGVLGPQLISFPMGVALIYFRGSDDANANEERQRLTASIGRLSEVGLSLATFLKSLQAAGSSKLESGPSENAWRGGPQVWFGAKPKKAWDAA
ncbi:MAG: hypothetical protein Q9184_001233 [Pyrenodesmia sp. 2 TL-2023]